MKHTFIALLASAICLTASAQVKYVSTNTTKLNVEQLQDQSKAAQVSRYFFAGMIYTQSGNYKDFYDPITVIYGHNMRNDTMFSTLLYFEKADFFKKNEYFYIYTLDRVLTYRIVSAYRYDNRHLLNAFDFYDPKVLADYQKGIVNPISTLRNVRDGITLDENSKIVTLSTCMPNDKKHRFLVNGVLISDIPIQE